MTRPILIEPHAGVFGTDYVRVTVEGYPTVLLRFVGPHADSGIYAWMYLAPDGRVQTALTQREAVLGALGLHDLPNWRA